MTDFMVIIKPDVQRVKRKTKQHAPDNRGWFIAALGGSGMSRNVEIRGIPEGMRGLWARSHCFYQIL